MQDPSLYLNEIGVDLACCVDTVRPAIISDSYRVMLGFESFFFADSAAMLAFLSDIPRYCGVLTDPVTKDRFRPDENSPWLDYNGQTYLFASASSHSMFEAMPAMYYLPNYSMLPRDSTAQTVTTD